MAPHGRGPVEQPTNVAMLMVSTAKMISFRMVTPWWMILFFLWAFGITTMTQIHQEATFVCGFFASHQHLKPYDPCHLHSYRPTCTICGLNKKSTPHRIFRMYLLAILARFSGLVIRFPKSFTVVSKQQEWRLFR